MKIKSLSFFILAGIVIISICVDSEAQSLKYPASNNLYRNICNLYAGQLDNRSHGMQDVHPKDSISKNSYPNSESVHTLGHASSLLERNIENAEITSLRIKAGIQYQYVEGKNVSRLEALLEKYNLLVEEAKQYKALADRSVSEGTEKEYLIRSQKNMIQVNGILKEIFEEFKQLIPRSEELNYTSRLSAVGEGKASLMGNFTLNLHMEEGEMSVVNLSNDSKIHIKGDYIFREKNTMQDEVRLYHIHSADVNISGSRKTILLRGKNINFTVDGEVYSVFEGNGTYTIEDAGKIRKMQNWAHPYLTDRINPDKHRSVAKNHNSENPSNRKGGCNITKVSKVKKNDIRSGIK